MSTNNTEVKKRNRRRIFRYILQNGRVSMPQVAAALDLSGPTILFNVRELMEENLLIESGTADSKGGRRAKAISAAVNARYAVGLDITRSHISAVLVNLAGDLIGSIRINRPFTNSADYLKELGTLVGNLVKENSVQSAALLGVGVSLPGIIDYRRDRMSFSHTLGVFHVPLEEIRRHLPCDCVFINDANAALLAESACHPEYEGAVYLSLSNSVGGALLRNALHYEETANYAAQRLSMGAHWRSGEFGHMLLHPGGLSCYCGKTGCFDAYCNAGVLTGQVGGDLKTFFVKLKADDEGCRNLWEMYLDNLALHIHNLHMAFDENIIVGGYVGSFLEPYLVDLRQRVRKLDPFSEDAGYVQACKFHFEASALGAALIHIGSFVDQI